MIHFHILSAFPESFSSYFSQSLIKRAIEKKIIKVSIYDLRAFASDKRKSIDGRPYGGGPGMVLLAEPIIKAIKKIKGRKKNFKIIVTSAGGKTFSNELAEKWKGEFKHILIICGHYEGIDARLTKIFKAQEISIGPYILTGGELPALVMVDVITRRLEGVLGKEESVEEKRIASHEVYTRPEIIEYQGKKYKVPKVLLSGHHKKIDAWRKKKS
ncbi:MAG TPA: tRNA (guanosine(37)-N1)-methyltransferase TrmD [Candidatus Vogelbacteria bacterium]|nr:tRNA (guanosine(37)-N1)-methyltransferase TrmD [Candidatus Vogelbacteria bacterium]